MVTAIIVTIVMAIIVIIGIDNPRVRTYPHTHTHNPQADVSRNQKRGNHAFPSYHRIRETEGLPVIPVIVCGCASTLMIDSGSCLNLVGEQFVRDVLGIHRENISPTEIKIKGISGNTVSALGEVKLNLRIIGQSFDIIFIVILNAVFPADLLLSYWGLVYCKLVIDFGRKLIKLDKASIPSNLAHSDSSLNRARSIHCNS